MTPNNPFIAFLSELFQRFATKSPKFFQIFQWILGALTAVSGIPELLTYMNVHIPAPFDIFANKFIAACAGGAFIMAMLPTQSVPKSLDANGVINKQTDSSKLPFTASVEEKTAMKIGVAPTPPPVPDPNKPDDKKA